MITWPFSKFFSRFSVEKVNRPLRPLQTQKSLASTLGTGVYRHLQKFHCAVSAFAFEAIDNNTRCCRWSLSLFPRWSLCSSLSLSPATGRGRGLGPAGPLSHRPSTGCRSLTELWAGAGGDSGGETETPAAGSRPTAAERSGAGGAPAGQGEEGARRSGAGRGRAGRGGARPGGAGRGGAGRGGAARGGAASVARGVQCGLSGLTGRGRLVF